MKPVAWIGSSLRDLKAFQIRRGTPRLEKVQRGEQPDDWKPRSAIDIGVSEIRIRDMAGAPFA